MRTVEELQAAGIAAMTIEDTCLPRAFGEDKPRPVTIAEGVGKMRAAVAARTDPDLVILARTGAITMTGLDDTLERVRAYSQTGVDGIFIAGAKSRAEVDALRAATHLPLVLGALTPELSDRAFLSSQGVPVALQGHAPIMAAAEAVRKTMQALRDGVEPGKLEGVPGEAFIRKVTRDEAAKKAIDAFMK